MVGVLAISLPEVLESSSIKGSLAGFVNGLINGVVEVVSFNSGTTIEERGVPGGIDIEWADT